MAICGRCSATYSGFTCPNCVQIRAIEKQTRAQAKFHKQQMKAMNGGGAGGGGVVAGVVGAFLNLFLQGFIILTKLFIRIYAEMFKILRDGLKFAYDRNPEKFMKVVKGIAIAIGAAFAILAVAAFISGVMKAS